MTGAGSMRESEIAGLGIRALAAIIDLAIMALLWTAIAVAIGGAKLYRADFSLDVVTNLLGLIAICIYFFASEAMWSATPAKLLIGLRVVGEDDGQPIDWITSMLRNVLRLVDWLPTPYLAGFLLAVNSPKNQRLGGSSRPHGRRPGVIAGALPP